MLRHGTIENRREKIVDILLLFATRLRHKYIQFIFCPSESHIGLVEFIDNIFLEATVELAGIQLIIWFTAIAEGNHRDNRRGYGLIEAVLFYERFLVVEQQFFNVNNFPIAERDNHKFSFKPLCLVHRHHIHGIDVGWRINRLIGAVGIPPFEESRNCGQIHLAIVDNQIEESQNEGVFVGLQLCRNEFAHNGLNDSIKR